MLVFEIDSRFEHRTCLHNCDHDNRDHKSPFPVQIQGFLTLAAKRISEDTKPELVVRSFLFRHGFRFQPHVKVLPGHPDIVLSKYKTVIEVRGCFWHRHPGCRQTTTPSTNVEFWQEKFKRNVDRDRKTEKQQKELGWNLIVVWQCELQKDGFLETLPDKIKKHLP